MGDKEHHSEDYKISAVLYYIENKDETNLRETCDIFKCKHQSLYRWVKKYEEDGELQRKVRDSKPLKITNDIKAFIKEEIIKLPTITLMDLAIDIKAKFKLGITSIFNIAKELNFSRKRVREKYYPAKKEETEQIDLENHYTELQRNDYKKTICLDETAIKLNMTLSYGRSKKGDRVYKKTNKYPFKKYNLLCAICADKVVGWTLFPEINTGVKHQDIIDFYNTYIKDKYNDYLIVMDNAVIHKNKKIKEVIEESCNKLMYSFAYHPETNTIEEYFSQLKHYIKKESPQTYPEISPVIEKIIKEKIKKDHLRHYLYHMYYPEKYPEKKN